VDRLELVELIEGEKPKLSPRARELWDELDALIYMSSDERKTLSRQEHDVIRRMSDLPPADEHVLDRLKLLRAALYQSDRTESRGQSGERHRVESVIRAAMLKDRAEGRQIDPNMTLEQAVARLREDP
jgi:hypothetical protein